ncbi:MAG: MarR family winged helix-turn-helix transcriptional regulator [Thermoprotei archaeon]|nr:MarR family transcriptional regulator [TACK group archaeon]
MGNAVVKEIEFWHGIVEAWKRIEKASDFELRKLGIGLQEYRVLRCLHLNGTCTMTEASRTVLMSPGGLTPLIDSMEKRGLVMRTRSQEDRRVVNLTITGRGERVLEESNLVLENFTRRLLEDKSSDEVYSVLKFMRSVSERTADL